LIGQHLEEITLLAPRQNYRRGFAVAVLVGLKEDEAALWRVYSNVAKPEKTVRLGGFRGDPKAVYNFHEATVNALRPVLKEGVKSVILASPPRTNYAADFLQHVRNHHAWLVQGSSKTTFAQITGPANTAHEVTELTRTADFKGKIGEATEEETENLLELLERRLNASGQELLVVYSLEDAEDKILGAWTPGKAKPDYLLLTDAYLSASRQKNRLQKLMAVAANRSVKTRVVNSKTSAGKRLMQLGGIVCILTVDRAQT
jgi:stalled ribosome rescue protein Dom34